MPLFDYKALQPDGAIAEGQLEAAGRPEAFRQMEGLGLRPVSLAEKSGGQAAKKRRRRLRRWARCPSNWVRDKISARALENFTRLLSSLLAAGVPLSRALVILHKEASTPAAAAKWKEIHDLVIDGMSLADAMAKSPETFPRVYVAMVQAGETGGFLDVVLAQIADFQAREKELRVEGDDRDAVSDHPARPRAGRGGVPADVFHSRVSADLFRLRRGAAVADANHRRRQRCGALVRAVRGRGAGGRRAVAAQLVRFRKRPARRGKA